MSWTARDHLSLPLSLPLHRSDDEKCEENHTPMAGNHMKILAEREEILTKRRLRRHQLGGRDSSALDLGGNIARVMERVEHEHTW